MRCERSGPPRSLHTRVADALEAAPQVQQAGRQAGQCGLVGHAQNMMGAFIGQTLTSLLCFSLKILWP